MTVKAFSRNAELLELSELEKLRLLALYFLKTAGVDEFDKALVREWFADAGVPDPNVHRLFQKAGSTAGFIRGRRTGTLRLHPREVAKLEPKFPSLAAPTEDVEPIETILPLSLVTNTRTVIERLALQINACYANNIFDGCAVLMRRLIEVLLILAYEKAGKSKSIQKQDGSFESLDAIIGDAQSGQSIKVSRDSREVLDKFRLLGNFSAHGVYYSCRRSDIDNVALHYRATVEELLFVSGLRV